MTNLATDIIIIKMRNLRSSGKNKCLQIFRSNPTRIGATENILKNHGSIQRLTAPLNPLNLSEPDTSLGRPFHVGASRRRNNLIMMMSYNSEPQTRMNEKPQKHE